MVIIGAQECDDYSEKSCCMPCYSEQLKSIKCYFTYVLFSEVPSYTTPPSPSFHKAVYAVSLHPH